MLSVIIPTRNEAAHLPRLLDALLPACDSAAVEVIVADGHSRDGTADHVRPPARLLLGPDPSRSSLMNLGAAHARGDALLFLHADTFLPPNFAVHVDRALARPGVVGGAFDFAFTEQHWGLTWVAFANRLRIAVEFVFYGDQALFVRREVFERLGGFRPRPVMEDAEFSRRLARHGRLALVRAPVRTSGRNFLERGFVATTALMVSCIILDYFDLLHWNPLLLAPRRPKA